MSQLSFIIFIAFFVSILSFIGLNMGTVPGATIITPVNLVVFVGSLAAVAGACVIATGIPCAAAIGISSVLNIFTVQNTVIGVLVFTPITVGIGFVMASLARGTS